MREEVKAASSFVASHFSPPLSMFVEGLVRRRGGGEMTLHFSRVPVEDMKIWSATGDGLSFVISHQSRGSPGFQGPPGFVVSWRQLDHNTPAIRLSGSPFKTFAEAERACKDMLRHLTRKL